MEARHPHFMWTNLFRRETQGHRPLASALRRHYLFETLTGPELNYLTHLVYQRVYQIEEPLFRQNDRGLGVYYIMKGRVAIRTQTLHSENFVTTLAEGSLLGEVALVDPHHIRTATALASERSIILGFFKPDLDEILRERPPLGAKILYQLACLLGRRLVQTTDKITQLNRPKKDSLS